MICVLYYGQAKRNREGLGGARRNLSKAVSGHLAPLQENEIRHKLCL